jgi:hypothetical protein
LDIRTFGSSAAYNISTIKLAIMMKNAPKITVPIINGRSSSYTASSESVPIPFRPKVLSVISAPPSKPPRSNPKIVRIEFEILLTHLIAQFE